MILDFTNYKMRPGYSYPTEIIIYPGLQLKVTREKNVVSYHVPGGENEYASEITLKDDDEARKLMRDMDKYLQYRTDELPEYRL